MVDEASNEAADKDSASGGEFAPEMAVIMILDDSKLTRWRMQSDLKELGFENLVLTETGAQFWEMLSNHTPDLILLDLLLPDTDGGEVLRRLREKKTYVDTPVIVVTSLKTGAPLTECFEMGANDYLRKPWDSVELNARIRNHLRRRQAEKAVLRAKAEWENTFDAVPDMIAVLDHDHRCRRVNRAMSERLGIPQSEIIGKHCYELFHAHDEDMCNCGLRQTILDGKSRHKQMFNKVLNADFWVSTSPIRDTRGAITSVVHVVRDVSERVRLEKQLQYDATHDLMTNVLNRNTFIEQIGREIANAKRHGYPLAMAMGDLDHFKQVNDTMGHQAGDEVLRQFAKILKSTIREGDYVGRYGGEEFALIFPHGEQDGVANCLDSILAQLREKVFTGRDQQDRHVSATFGFSMLIEDDQEPDTLIARADRALYDGKESGRDQVCFRAE